jgi:hypothetical protein
MASGRMGKFKINQNQVGKFIPGLFYLNKTAISASRPGLSIFIR